MKIKLNKGEVKRTTNTHLIVIHVSGGGAPGDGQITCSCVVKPQIPNSSWN